MKRLFNSFKYALNGIKNVFIREKNIKIHLLAMILVIIFGFSLNLDKYEWIVCVICFAMVIGAEMINTSIELSVDLAEPNINEKAKLAKDIAAGAVLFISICSAIIGCIIFIPKFIEFLSNFF